MAGKGRSIYELAKRLGIATSTVSRALNNKPGMSDALREKILAAAAEMHYVPNALTRSLQLGRSNTIGVFTWEVLTVPYLSIVSALTLGLTAGIKNLGCDMLNYSYLPDRTPEHVASTFLDGRVDGVIAASHHIDNKSLSDLVDANLPTVVIYSQAVPDGIGYVAIDNRSGISAAVDHLVELGHKHIAYYAPIDNFDFQDRLDAYKQRLVHHGLDVNPDFCVMPNLIPSNPSIVCDRLLGSKPRPTAVLAGNDDDAYQLIEHFKARGLRIPEDMSVVGFDGTAQHYSIPITSIRQPAFQVGETAAKLVGGLIAGKPASECRVVLPVEFVASESTGPAPKS
jgi:LacI family transcriptional regulator